MKKLVRKGANDYEVSIYIDGVFEHHLRLKTNNGIVQVEQDNNTLHVMDNQSRIALVRAGEAFKGDSATDKPVQYHLGDHLGSSHVVIGGTTSSTANVFMNREEYFPYGETSFGSFARKRYRFSGKERDEESGLNYHGARYYAPWLARWVSCDPESLKGGINLYSYGSSAPTQEIDEIGTNPKKVVPDALEWLAKRGETIAAHPAKKHARKGIEDMLNRQMMGHGQGENAREVSKLIKGNQAKKLVEKTLKGPDSVVEQQGAHGVRYLFQKEFGRDLSPWGSRVMKVVIEVGESGRFRKFVTYFPSSTLRNIVLSGGFAGTVFASTMTEAAEKGYKQHTALDAADSLEQKKEFALGFLLPDFLVSSPISHEDTEGLRYQLDTASALISRVERALGYCLGQDERNALRDSVFRAYNAGKNGNDVDVHGNGLDSLSNIDSKSKANNLSAIEGKAFGER